jgi:hypothetical protein
MDAVTRPSPDQKPCWRNARAGQTVVRLTLNCGQDFRGAMGAAAASGEGLAPLITVTPRSEARVAAPGRTSVAAEASAATSDTRSAATDARPKCDMADLSYLWRLMLPRR